MAERRIAVVEDDDFQVAGLTLLLERNFSGCSIRVFRSEQEFDQALETIQADVVIMDCILVRGLASNEDNNPFVAGIRAIQKLRSHPASRQTPVVLRTLVDEYELSPYFAQLDSGVSYVGKSIEDDSRLVQLLKDRLA